MRTSMMKMMKNIKSFLRDIRYDTGIGDKKRFRTLKRLFGMRRGDIFARNLVEPSNLIKRPELPILETKAGHDGFFDEMLNIS